MNDTYIHLLIMVNTKNNNKNYTYIINVHTLCTGEKLGINIAVMVVVVVLLDIVARKPSNFGVCVALGRLSA